MVSCSLTHHSVANRLPVPGGSRTHTSLQISELKSDATANYATDTFGFSKTLKPNILMKLTEGSLWWRTDHHSNIMGLSFLAHLQYSTSFIKNQVLIFPFISRLKIVSRLARFLRSYTTLPYYPYATYVLERCRES